MEHVAVAFYQQGPFYCTFLLVILCICGFQEAVSDEPSLEPKTHTPDKFVFSDPPIGLFDPIEISPSVVPRNPYPLEPLSPMYPSFPHIYEPVLTGKCPLKFSSLSGVMEQTASDCSAPLAALVGNVICCPQVTSLVHIMLGTYSSESGSLVLHQAVVDDCFSDITSILVSKGANTSIPALCSVKPSNLTGGSCPVKDVVSFEKIVNTSKLLDSCATVDPLKECCRPICQPAIVEAALQISKKGADVVDTQYVPGTASQIDVVNDCKGVVYAWLSRALSMGAANTAFRILSSCKVNKVCPLGFKDPSAVVKACRGLASPNPYCCSSLNSYIAIIQRQMLITNRQAIICATVFGSMLQKGGVMANVYELCDVDLKDFSLQAYGQQGCLLRSLPQDVVFDNSTGFSFTCDLSDNIAAPWPSSSSLTSLSLCAPEMSLPALPIPQASGTNGYQYGGFISSSISVLYAFFSLIV